MKGTLYILYIILAVLIVMLICVALTSCSFKGFSFGDLMPEYVDAHLYKSGGAALEGELAEGVERVVIDWVGGDVSVGIHDYDTIEFNESTASGKVEEKYELRWRLDEGTLRIHCYSSGLRIFRSIDKSLTLNLPYGLLEGLDIDSVSADMTLSGLELRELELRTVSGGIVLNNLRVTDLAEVETVSGDFLGDFGDELPELVIKSISGDVQISAPRVADVSAESISGDQMFMLNDPPGKLKASSVSGNVTIALPDTADFDLTFKTLSGKLTSELSSKVEGGMHRFGSGAAKDGGEFVVSTTSGDLEIRDIDSEGEETEKT
ncbi:MAG: DUF4097 domain-containing protein [Clostridiales bacterium]|nr:DUF4097 domain-containing protein [Clostridiales bacterium]